MFEFTNADQRHEFETLADARLAAGAVSEEINQELEVIHTETGAVAYVATPVKGRNFRPWERVTTPNFAAPSLEGFRPAYTRSRIGAVVYRKLDLSGWLVLNVNTGERIETRTTAQAREVTNRMRAEA